MTEFNNNEFVTFNGKKFFVKNGFLDFHELEEGFTDLSELEGLSEL